MMFLYIGRIRIGEQNEFKGSDKPRRGGIVEW